MLDVSWVHILQSMEKNQRAFVLVAGLIGLLIICAGLWWAIFNHNNLPTSNEVVAPITQIPSQAEPVSPILRPDAPKLAGSVIVGPKVPTKFYLARDGKRYVFPDETNTFETWKSMLPPVVHVSEDTLEAYPLGGNVWYRPATRLIRIQSDPRIFAVAHGGVLRSLNEGTAEMLFGKNWQKLLDTLQDYYFSNYTMGDPILSAQQYSIQGELGASLTIEADKNI